MEPLYRFTELLLCRPLRHGLRWHTEGLERIPRRGPVLIASNHVSYFDPLALAYVSNVAGRRARFLAKVELFDNRWMGPLMRAFKHIPVDRGTADASGALEQAAAALAAGECVAVFPEGTLSNDLEPMAGRTGAARLARAAGVPVVPLGLWGTHRVIPPPHCWPDRRPSLRFGRAITAVLGEPVIVGEKDNPREATDRIMAGVCAAVSRAREIYPQGPEPGEDAWWVRAPETVRLRSCRGRLAQQMLDDHILDNQMPDDQQKR